MSFPIHTVKNNEIKNDYTSFQGDKMTTIEKDDASFFISQNCKNHQDKKNEKSSSPIKA